MPAKRSGRPGFAGEATARIHDVKYGDDQRKAFQRDRDRILYSQPFLRLAGVTQVVTPGEGLIFHSRLTHSLKVGQVARRIAEYLKEKDPRHVAAGGGLEPEVAEAAGLAHDVGHPPFGHAAEKALTDLVAEGMGEKTSSVDGYEGNAQAFRVLTKLAVHRTKYPGLNLTRHTLRAVLKYPWVHDPTDAKRRRKYGAYSTELEQLNWVLGMSERDSAASRSLEAAAMDLADDLTYSIHDLTDFFRAGLIDPAAVAEKLMEREYIRRWVTYLENRYEDSPTPTNARVLAAAREQPDPFYVASLKMLLGDVRYSASLEARATLDVAASSMIGKTLRSASLQQTDAGWTIDIPNSSLALLKFLQRVVWTEVIESQRLRSQQAGQRVIVEALFRIFLEWIKAKEYHLLPPVLAELAEASIDAASEDNVSKLQLRFAADVVASLTDAEAIRFYQRVSGVSLGSIMDIMPSSFS